MPGRVDVIGIIFAESSLIRCRVFVKMLRIQPPSMSKKYKSQASSARAAIATFGAPAFGFGAPSGFQATSSLSYVAEQPDLSGVSDPHVVVSLRNLSKKDSTTKSKALEELQEHVKSTATVEEAVIAAWVR